MTPGVVEFVGAKAKPRGWWRRLLVAIGWRKFSEWDVAYQFRVIANVGKAPDVRDEFAGDGSN